MPRPKKPSSAVAASKPSKLLEAIKFVTMAAKDIGPIQETHIFLGGKWAAMSNGIITIASKIEEEIYACPQAKLFLEALSRSGENFSLTQLEKTISIKSGKFKAVIPCIDPTLLSIPGPDDPVANINDILKKGMEIVGILANENAQSIIPASILLNGKSVVASDRRIMIEFWHGIDLPSGLSIPKAIVKPLSQTNKKLVKLGFSAASLTFHFEDESWIKTQLYIEKWPEINQVLNLASKQEPFPKDFWEAVAAVKPFTDELCYFDAGRLCSHVTDDAGASFECPGLPAGPVFSVRQLEAIKPLAKTVDFQAPGPFGSTMLTFRGENIRGCIAGRT